MEHPETRQSLCTSCRSLTHAEHATDALCSACGGRLRTHIFGSITLAGMVTSHQQYNGNEAGRSHSTRFEMTNDQSRYIPSLRPHDVTMSRAVITCQQQKTKHDESIQGKLPSLVFLRRRIF